MPLIQPLTEGGRQPDYFAPINRAHPLGQKARFVLVGNSPFEVIRSIRPTGTIGIMQPVSGGLAYVTSGTTNWAAAISDLDPMVGGSFTVHWHGVLRANTVQTLLRSSSGHGWRVDTINFAADRLVFRLLAAFGGTGYSTPNVEVLDGTLHSVAVRYDDENAAAEFFLDGTSIGAGSFTKDAVAMNATQTFSVTGHATLPHKMLTVQAYSGMLSDADIAGLTADSWQILEPDEISIWVPAAGGGTHELTVDASTQANSSSVVAITQEHALDAAGSTQANTSSTVAITQEHALDAAGSTQANTSSTVAIAQEHALALTGSEQANTSAALIIAQEHALDAAISAQANASSMVSITQAHSLVVAPSTQSNASSDVQIVQGVVVQLACENSTQINNSSEVAITQRHELMMAPSVQDNMTTALNIAQMHLLAPRDCIQINLSGTVAIFLPGVAVPIDAPKGGGPRLRAWLDRRPRMARDTRPDN